MTPPSPDYEDPRDAVFDTRHLNRDLGKRAGRGSIVVLLFSLLKVIVQLGSTAILARLIAPQDHGIVAMAMPVILIATGLSEFGLADALVQRDKVTHRAASALFWTNTFIGLGLAMVVAGLAVPAAQFYGEPRVAAVFAALAPTILFGGMLAQFVALLRRQMRLRQAETILFAAMVVSIALAVCVALLGGSYWAIVAQVVAQPLAGLILLALASGWLPSRPSIAGFRATGSYLSFGGSLALSRLIFTASQSAAIVLVGRMFSTADAGLYYRSWNLANLPALRAVSPLAGAFLPSFSRAAHDPEAFCALFQRAATRVALITVPIGVGLCTGADLVVAVLLGPQWLSSGPILAWMGILTLQANAMHTGTWALTAMGQSRALLWHRLFAAAVVLLALFVGAQYGLKVMVAVYMLSLLIGVIPALWALCVRYTPLTRRILWVTFGPDICLAAAAIAVIWSVRLGVANLWPDPAIGIELLLVIGLVLATMAVRILPDAGLRQDVIKAMALVASSRKA
ncbi:lipopolysaccharide biosynthesis protein [Tritonibacter litoralis]|nr:lipopolysaccharide biosynthesis protein [Tritonibacter litoralis]